MYKLENNFEGLDTVFIPFLMIFDNFKNSGFLRALCPPQLPIILVNLKIEKSKSASHLAEPIQNVFLTIYFS